MIVVAARCYNEEANIPRFLRGYDWADKIVISDGGSTDNSIEMLKSNDKVHLVHFEEFEEVGGYRWNPDGKHMNFVINAAKSFNPDWIVMDDMDDVPNAELRGSAREILEGCTKEQVNVFRLYMWGDDEYFPQMNGHFHPDYASLWAWKPKEVDIRADENIRHGTLTGIIEDNYKIPTPKCLLHKSWHPDTIEEKMNRYNTLDLPMHHPLNFAGERKQLPPWAVE